MEHIAAIMLLVACSDDLGACREMPAAVPFYMSAAECEAELEPAIIAVTQSAPQAFGQCLAVDPAGEGGDATVTWEIREDGVFRAALEYNDVLIASASDGGAKYSGRVKNR